MITLLSTLAGFFSSLLPAGIKLYQDKQDKKHELDILNLQMQRDAQGHTDKMQEIESSNLITLNQGIRDEFKSGNRTADFLNNTVRPILTYGLFFDYILMKVLTVYIAIHNDAAYEILYPILWGDEDRAIFGAIVGYYFGNRTMTKR